MQRQIRSVQRQIRSIYAPLQRQIRSITISHEVRQKNSQKLRKTAKN